MLVALGKGPLVRFPAANDKKGVTGADTDSPIDLVCVRLVATECLREGDLCGVHRNKCAACVAFP